jgi:hypothetical protein
MGGIDDQMRDIKTRQELITYVSELKDPCDVVIVALERDPERPDSGRPRIFMSCQGGIPKATFLCNVAHAALMREAGL